MHEHAEQNDAAARLGAARVAIIGVGALGCPAARALAQSGIGTLRLVDPDVVELSNLHRQTLHGVATIGTAKVLSAADRLRREYGDVIIEPHTDALRADNAERLLAEVDFIIDATDGVAAKFLVNDVAVALARPFSHAGILGFLGQTMTVLPRRSACYRCLFPEPPDPDEVPTCQAAGVVGGIAGVIGTIQAGEAIKYLTGQGTLLSDRLLTVDALGGAWRRVQLARNPRCPVCAGPAASGLDAPDTAGYGERIR